MVGNNRIILQERDLHLLRELSVMRVIDREQAKVVAGFGSTSRANVRLLALTRAGALRRFFLGSGGGRKALYVLSPQGAQAAQLPWHGLRRPQDAVLIADYFIAHQLAVNALYCALKYGVIPIPYVTFHRWQSFHEPVVPGIRLIPDGYVEFTMPQGITGCFLEVDLGHESQTIWRRKAEHYLEFALSGKYQEHFGQDRFRVLVLANSERRLHSIRKTVRAITQKIFWFATLASLRSDFFARVWFRAEDNQPAKLFETIP
jgi:hypothetical protein